MNIDQDIKELAGMVKAMLEEQRGEFRPEDFVALARELGFEAFARSEPQKTPKLVGENHIPDIIGTNLEHALQTYEWSTRIPMTEDGIDLFPASGIAAESPCLKRMS